MNDSLFRLNLHAIQHYNKTAKINTKKIYSLTNIVRAVQSKLRNSKYHFGVDTRYVNVYSCPYKTSFPDHPQDIAFYRLGEIM